MKKSIQLLLLFVSLFTVSFAQMKEGTINYSMDFSSDNPDMAMGISMMQGSKMTLSFMPGASRTEIMMGTFGTISTVADEKSGNVLMLMDMMGMKNAVKTTQKEMQADTKKAADEMKVELTNETKEISGYKCKKAVVTTADGQKVDVWYTDQIQAYTEGHQYFSNKIPGIPMSFSANANGMTVNFNVTSIEKTADKSKFTMTIPEGYTEKSYEDMKKMGK